MRYAISLVAGPQRPPYMTTIAAGPQHPPYMTTIAAGPQHPPYITTIVAGPQRPPHMTTIVADPLGARLPLRSPLNERNSAVGGHGGRASRRAGKPAPVWK